MIAAEAALSAGDYPAGRAAAYRLLVCDVDSTLITGEVIEMLADYSGHRAEVEDITAAAMRGEWDFEESLRRRVALLRGLDAMVLDEVGRGLVLTPGARMLMDAARRHGWRRGIVSGGFTQVTRYLVDELDLDYAAANTLEIDGGVLTGSLTGPIVDRAGKARSLRSFARRFGIPMAETVAIGDGANDIDMLQAAGFGIAFHAKPIVGQHADYALDGPSLEPVLALLGLA